MVYAIILLISDSKYDVIFDDFSKNIIDAAEAAAATFGDKFAHVLTYSQFQHSKITVKNGRVRIG